MASIAQVLVAAAAVATVVVVASSSKSGGGGGTTKPPPKRVGRTLASYTPATLRSTAPGTVTELPPEQLSWRAFEGSLVIGSIRKPNRDILPGFDTIDLAEVYDGPGPVRVFADVYVADNSEQSGGSTANAIANVVRAHYNSGVPLPTDRPTEQAERVTRDFSVSNAGLIEGEQTFALLEHNESDPPRLPGFYGTECQIGPHEASNSLYHLDHCRGAFRERSGKPESAYPEGRTYNLTLEVRPDGKVYLVARIMRLPLRQYLRWRAFTSSERP